MPETIASFTQGGERKPAQLMQNWFIQVNKDTCNIHFISFINEYTIHNNRLL